MRTYAIDQRTSDIFSTSAEDDLLVNPLSPSPVHLVINGLDGRDTLVFPGERNGYRDLSITMDDDGATRISGTEASGFFFGFATQFKYFDITLTNFESIRFTQADGTFDTIDVSAQSAEDFIRIQTGSWSRDQFSGSDKHDDFDGGMGLDTVAYARSRAEFTLTTTASGYQISRGSNDLDTLTNIERLQFADKKIALDLAPDGNAGQAMEFIGVIAPALLDSAPVRGLIISLFDQGQTMEGLCQQALDIDLVTKASNAELANAVFHNVTGSTANQEMTNSLVGYIESHSQANFLAAVAGMHINVDLVGLQQTGIEYIL